jgi:hypothetical protein
VGSTDWNRTLSLVAAAITLVASLVISTDLFARLLIAEVGILLFIWFGDTIGAYTGLMIFPSVTQETPGCFIRAFGWLMQAAVLATVVLVGIRGVHPH